MMHMFSARSFFYRCIYRILIRVTILQKEDDQVALSAEEAENIASSVSDNVEFNTGIEVITDTGNATQEYVENIPKIDSALVDSYEEYVSTSTDADLPMNQTITTPLTMPHGDSLAVSDSYEVVHSQAMDTVIGEDGDTEETPGMMSTESAGTEDHNIVQIVQSSQLHSSDAPEEVLTNTNEPFSMDVDHTSNQDSHVENAHTGASSQPLSSTPSASYAGVGAPNQQPAFVVNPNIVPTRSAPFTFKLNAATTRLIHKGPGQKPQLVYVLPAAMVETFDSGKKSTAAPAVASAAPQIFPRKIVVINRSAVTSAAPGLGSVTAASSISSVATTTTGAGTGLSSVGGGITAATVEAVSSMSSSSAVVKSTDNAGETSSLGYVAIRQMLKHLNSNNPSAFHPYIRSKYVTVTLCCSLMSHVIMLLGDTEVSASNIKSRPAEDTSNAPAENTSQQGMHFVFQFGSIKQY